MRLLGWNPAVVHQAVGRAVRIGQRAVVEIHMFRVVDGVMDNMDRKMVEIHGRKIECAKEVCPSLYEGFAPLGEEGFDSVPGSGLVDPASLVSAYESLYASMHSAPAALSAATATATATAPASVYIPTVAETDEDPTSGGVEDVD